jgi:hypothetical protein
MSVNAVEIYALVDPRDGVTKYIGKANNSAARLKSHVRDSHKRDTPVYQWFRELAAIGIVPRCVVLERVQEDWQSAERRLIAQHSGLLNVAAGGNEPYCSPSTRANNGKSVAALRASTPERKRVYELKRIVGQMLRKGQVSEANMAKLRYAAMRAPQLFGAWANL